MGTGKGDREFCECGGGIGEHDWREHQTAVDDNLYRISQGWDPGPIPTAPCRHCDCKEYRARTAAVTPPVRVAPSLAEVRQARRGVARDIEKRKEELAAHLASVFPDCNFVVRIAFDVRPDTTPERRAAAEAKIKAAGIVSEPCQCLRWEEWAQTIVGARGHAEAYKSLRDRVTAVLGTASKTTSDAHQVGRDALAVTRAAQQDAENARKAERSADGRLRQAQSLLRRCYCGRPDPDPEYPRDRDKYLGRE